MKKIITFACAVTAISFSAVLAHADDSTSNSGDASLHSTAPVTTESTTQTTDETGNKMTSTSKWKNMKTCTDSDGVTYYRGKKGYSSCVTAMKKNSAKKDQMSGVSGSDTSSSPSTTSDSAATSGTNSDSGNTNSGNTDTSSTR